METTPLQSIPNLPYLSHFNRLARLFRTNGGPADGARRRTTDKMAVSALYFYHHLALLFRQNRKVNSIFVSTVIE
ncbi:MAG: hypothetical protein GY854_34005 [Deltaproteobacteria bacterium]|nr:hypothetical protein [Deltaproteobacteria bacterium]